MNIIYEFTNLKTDVAPSLDGKEMVITRVHYDYLATDTDSGKSARIQNYQDFELGAGSVFTPFTSLTKSMVLSWLETRSSVESFKEILTTDIKNQTSTMYVRVDAPWETPIVEEPIVQNELTPPTDDVVEVIV